nr:hypothetical protein [Azospirillum soli]
MDVSATPESGEVHKRTHEKRDGRKLYLYGWAAHDLPVTAELEAASPPRPHLRWHPLRGEWVAYASHRQERTFKPPAEFCPLCPVPEGGFPGEIPFADFEIAVFENRFPAFHPDAPPPPLDLPLRGGTATGQCEVVVYSAEHGGSLAVLPPERLALLVHVWADRYRDLLSRDAVAFVMPFENRGEEVGVTLHHPHGQIYAFPFVPPVVERMAAQFRDAPVLADMRQSMGEAYDIAGNEHAVAFVPPCARFPSEVWVMPRRFHPGPWTFSDEEAFSFGALLGETVARLDALYGRPMPYICCLYAAPKGEDGHFHFHVQFLPFLRTADRLKYLAGCEQGAGTFLVDALPEQMAARLREVTP